MILRTKSLGEIDFIEEAILHFPDGLLGFEGLKRYILAEVNEFLPFFWLISVDEPEIGFALMDPRLSFGSSYGINLSDADREVLGLTAGDAVSVFVIVSISDGGRRITANLQGPVVLNTRNRTGKQVVIYSPGYSVRQSLLAAEETAPNAGGTPRGRVAA